MLQTLWSWTLHTVCFMPFFPSRFWTVFTYGPSAAGSWALMVMWMWTMYANPEMEYKLAPPVRQCGIELETSPQAPTFYTGGSCPSSLTGSTFVIKFPQFLFA